MSIWKDFWIDCSICMGDIYVTVEFMKDRYGYMKMTFGQCYCRSTISHSIINFDPHIQTFEHKFFRAYGKTYDEIFKIWSEGKEVKSLTDLKTEKLLNKV